VEDFKKLKNELQNIVAGNEFERQTSLIKAAQNYLRKSFAASKGFENQEPSRTEEERALIDFANKNNLWYNEDDLSNFLAEGAEQKVYFFKDCVIKLADAIFYECWINYFDSILLHNKFFTNTNYSLEGFIIRNEKLLLVVKQPYISITEMTDLENVKLFLLSNGFIHKKNNDYYHPQLQIILEDLHDENVLTNNGVLFFIDTVFYLMDGFWEEAL
jgi:hypothetical protein